MNDFDDFLQEYRFLLIKALLDSGATYVKIEAERYLGSGRAAYAISAEHWPQPSDRNPGKLRQYLIEPRLGGQAVMVEIGNGLPVDLNVFDILAEFPA